MDQASATSYIHAMSISKSGSKTSIGQLGGLRGFMRNPGLFLHTLRSGAHAGTDALGNQFYTSPPRAGTTRQRRWVVYAGAPEASVIGPEWHAWLHFLTDQPLPDTGAKPWQLPHRQNLTGTPASYRPAGHDYSGGVRAKTSADYESWIPDNN